MCPCSGARGRCSPGGSVRSCRSGAGRSCSRRGDRLHRQANVTSKQSHAPKTRHAQALSRRAAALPHRDRRPWSAWPGLGRGGPAFSTPLAAGGAGRARGFFWLGHRVRLCRFRGDEAATVAAAGPMAQQEGRGLTRRKADCHDVNLPDAIPVAFGTGGRVGNASGAASSRRASRWQLCLAP